MPLAIRSLCVRVTDSGSLELHGPSRTASRRSRRFAPAAAALAVLAVLALVLVLGLACARASMHSGELQEQAAFAGA